jgi:DeoR family transcriptional regulator, carbon catabolite repression regulator
MNQEERMEAISHYLIGHSSIQIEDICDMFNVSKDTARRDLVRLEEDGRIIRTRGGAMKNSRKEDIPSYEVRMENITEDQRKIGRLAAEKVGAGDRIILDASTTVQTCSAALDGKECTVVTNSLHQADLLASYHSVNIHVVGGILHKSHRYMYGNEAVNSMSRFFADKAFIGVVGISEKGLTVAHEEDGAMKRKMIEQAGEVFVLADYTKFDRNDFVKIADLEEVDHIITDRPPGESLQSYFKMKNVTVHLI